MTHAHPLVREVLPELADALRSSLEAESEHDLAAQIDELRITAPHGCGDFHCGSFYTAPLSARASALNPYSIPIDDAPAWVVVDVVDNRIVYVEVLDWNAVRDRVAALFPSPRP